MRNVIIYIDYENIHQTLLHEDRNLFRIGFFEKLKKWGEQNELRILDIVCYCNFDLKDLYESHHQSKLQEYGINTIHTSNKGKNFADLKITTDLLEVMYNNNKVDGFILISNDKDMTPLISQVKKYKDFMYLITAGSNYDNTLLNFPDKHIHINEIESVEVDSLKVDEINKEVIESLEKYLPTKIKDYSADTKKIVHIGLEYYIQNSFSHFNIMKYEFANIVKRLVGSGDLFIYKYEFRGNYCNAVMLSSLKDECIKQNILGENDIVENYDFDSQIKKLYDSYKNI